MLNFAKNIKRIEYIADQILVKIQAEKLDDAQDDLLRILIHNNEALQQLDEFIKQQHINDGSVEG